MFTIWICTARRTHVYIVYRPVSIRNKAGSRRQLKNRACAVECKYSWIYALLIKTGNLFVGYDCCAAYDTIEIPRWFKCNEFHHFARSCKKAISCPRCSKNHDLKSCKSQHNMSCSECLNLKHISTGVSTNHAEWELNKCTAHNRAKDKVCNDILAVK